MSEYKLKITCEAPDERGLDWAWGQVVDAIERGEPFVSYANNSGVSFSLSRELPKPPPFTDEEMRRLRALLSAERRGSP